MAVSWGNLAAMMRLTSRYGRGGAVGRRPLGMPLRWNQHEQFRVGWTAFHDNVIILIDKSMVLSSHELPFPGVHRFPGKAGNSWV